MKGLTLTVAGVALIVAASVILNGQNSSYFDAQTQSLAREILRSSAADYLSASGRASLEFVTGERQNIPKSASEGDSIFAELFNRPTLAPNGEVMVNNPDQDFFTMADISTQSETAVAGFNRTVVVAFNDTGQLGSQGPPMVTGYSRSLDGGATFTDVGNLPTPPFGANFGDPGLAVDKHGNFYASSLVVVPGPVGQTVGIYKSTDGGLTWPVLAFAPPGTASAASDKPFIAVDTSASSFQGSVYTSWTSFEPPPPFGVPGLPIRFSRSNDAGLSFTPPIVLSAPNTVNQGSEPAVGPKGEVYVSWAQFSPGPQAVMVARSLDGGRTFSPPVAAAPFMPIGFGAINGIGGTLNGNFRVSVWPRIDVSPVSGNIYIVYATNPPGPDAADVFLVTSTDRGQTWSGPVRVNDDATQNDQFFPDVAVNDRGTVQVVWYDRRNDPENRLIDVYRARISADGRTVVANERVTSVSFPPAVGYDPMADRVYMGDYIDVKAFVTSTGRMPTFGAAWGDNRRQIVTSGGRRNDQDVFFRKF